MPVQACLSQLRREHTAYYTELAAGPHSTIAITAYSQLPITPGGVRQWFT